MISLAGFSGHLVTPSFVARHSLMRDPEVEARWRAAAAAWTSARHRLGPASSVRQVFDLAVLPFTEVFGFDRPSEVRATDRSVAASIRAHGHAVTLLTVPWTASLDASWRTAFAESQRRGSAWCLIFNGQQVRVVDASRLYGRRYVECDLPLVVDRMQSFAGLLRLIGGRALFADASDDRSLHAFAAASERDAAGVCRSLRDGVLSASADVLGALLARERRAMTDVIGSTFEQALTIVYRVVFLLFAEARALVPIWHPIYRESYSVEALREASERGARPRGLWDTLRAMSRMAHAGCQAGDLRVTPFNGRLFAPAHTPLAERRDLDDEAARRAVLALATRPTADRAGRERIVYRELGVEQLGAVYETLLDYQPRVTVTTRPARGSRSPDVSVSLQTGSGIRKATGTFYTPQPLADYLVRRTLAPLLRDATPDAILGLRIVDPAMGSGAFLVSACRHLASAYERALIESGTNRDGDFGEVDRTAMRRLIAERCLYGVDLNPMAVQLARLSLWLTTLAADRPLSFLDHRLMAGDSVLGVWLSQVRHEPMRVRRRDSSSTLPLFGDDAVAEAITAALPVRFSLELPNDTLDHVRAKERALASLTSSASVLSRWKRISDVWCATWFADASNEVPASAFRSLVDTVLSGAGELSSRMSQAYLERSAAIAAPRRFFHWELEFPEVFFDGNGRRLANPGFDAVIGNPPWDMMRADTAGREDVTSRSRERTAVAATVRFVRDAGIYSACGQGHGNRYQLFVERAIALTRVGGRLGLVLPSGFASDHGSAALRRAFMRHCDIDAIVGVDNVRSIFPIHRSVRFLLTTATAGRSTGQFRCRFGVENTTELEGIGDEEAGDAAAFPVALTPAALERLSGRSLSIPRLRHAIDLHIAEKAAALFAPLGSRDGWSVTFGRELNATDDRDTFRRSGAGWPVVDGRHLAPFHVDIRATSRSIAPGDAKRLLGADRADRPRLAYRDVASATNRLTLISAILPPQVVSTHTVFCLRTRLTLRDQYALCSLFNSFVVNYLVRLRVTTHVTTEIVEQLPIPRRDQAPAVFRELAAIARRLSRREAPEAFASLNAYVARLYQLTTEEFQHVLDTFPLMPAEERRRALTTFVNGA